MREGSQLMSILMAEVTSSALGFIQQGTQDLRHSWFKVALYRDNVMTL